MRSRRSRPAALVVSVLLGAAGCQSTTVPPPSSVVTPSLPPAVSPTPTSPPPVTPADFDHLLYASTYEPEQGTAGGTVVVGNWQRPTQLNPYFSDSIVNSEVLAATMRSLLTMTFDGRWRPDLAAEPITFGKSVTRDASGGGFTVHVRLKPGLAWSDGAALTLADLKFTWRWVLDKARVGINTFGWEHVDRIDVAADGLTADVHFRAPDPGWLAVVGRNPLLPEHYLAKRSGSAADSAYPLSAAIAGAPVSGPFKYVSASATAIELARNDRWAAGDHAPYLDHLTFRFFDGDKDALESAFTSGAIAVALDLRSGDYDAIKGVSPRLGEARLVTMGEYEHLDMNEAGLGQGRGHPALADPRVRQAIARAIDRNTLAQAAFPGLPPPAEPACVNVVPTSYWYVPGGAALCQPFDVAGANGLLDAAGYTRGADGVRVDPKSGLPLAFDHCTSTSLARQAGADYLSGALAAIGIKLTVRFVDSVGVLLAGWPDVPADAQCNLAHGNYDMAQFGYVVGPRFYDDFRLSYSSGQIPSDANKGYGFNYLRVRNPDLDAALTNLSRAIDPQGQIQAAYQVQRIYAQQALEVPLYYVRSVRGVAAGLHNYLPDPSASSFNVPITATDLWNVEDWWLSH